MAIGVIPASALLRYAADLPIKRSRWLRALWERSRYWWGDSVVGGPSNEPRKASRPGQSFNGRRRFANRNAVRQLRPRTQPSPINRPVRLDKQDVILEYCCLASPWKNSASLALPRQRDRRPFGFRIPFSVAPSGIIGFHPDTAAGDLCVIVDPPWPDNGPRPFAQLILDVDRDAAPD